MKAGGNVTVSWPIERAFAAGDRATGVPVLSELYAKLGKAPMKVDLPALWRELGVAADGRRTVFDDSAPLASIRRGITAGK